MIFRYSHIIILFIIILFPACKWNLDPHEIISYNQTISSFYEVGDNFKNAMIQTDDDRYIIVGNSTEGDIMLTIVSDEGLPIDSKIDYGKGVAHQIIPDAINSDQFVIAGTQDSSDVFLLWVDNDGQMIDMKNYRSFFDTTLGLIDFTLCYHVITLAEGGYLLTGAVKQLLGNQRLYALKVDQDGTPIWLRTYSNNTYGISLAETSDQQYLLSGYENDRIKLFKISAEGTIIWERSFTRIVPNLIHSILLDELDNIFLICTKALSPSNRNIYLIFLDIDGNKIWEKEIGLPDRNEQGHHISLTRDSSLLVLGVEEGDDTENILLYKANYTGDLTWQRRFTGAFNERPRVVKQVNDFGIAILSLSGAENPFSYRLIKTDEEGYLREE